jgi:hypothetical protein
MSDVHMTYENISEKAADRSNWRHRPPVPSN